MNPGFTTRRVYDEPTTEDGSRVLVDRLWPRGLTKEAARLDDWAKDLAPSTELRKWFDHDQERFDEFAEKYRAELDDNQEAVDAFLQKHAGERVTLLYAAKSTTCNHAPVLSEYLSRKA